jgi:hypothetical protein
MRKLSSDLGGIRNGITLLAAELGGHPLAAGLSVGLYLFNTLSNIELY